MSFSNLVVFAIVSGLTTVVSLISAAFLLEHCFPEKKEDEKDHHDA